MKVRKDGVVETQPVSGTVTANQGGAPWSVQGTAASGASPSGNPNVVAGLSAIGGTVTPVTVASVFGVNAQITTVLDPLTGNSVPVGAGGVTVDLGSNNDVIQATHDNFNANANVQVGDTDVSTSNPVPTQYLNSNQNNGTPVTLTTTSETTIKAAGGSGVSIDCLAISAVNTSEQSVLVSFRDATSGTIRFYIGLAPKASGIFPWPKAWRQATANNNWTAQLDVAASSVYVTFMGETRL